MTGKKPTTTLLHFLPAIAPRTGSVIKAWINLSPGRSSIMVKFATSIEDSGFGVLYCN